jgi:hypothetical protein
MDPFIFCLISTYVPEHVEILTIMAGGKLLKETKETFWGISTYANGVLHSFNDEPTYTTSGQAKYWHKLGKLHRDFDRPARIDPDGTQYWYQNGIVHRDNDKPAIISC